MTALIAVRGEGEVHLVTDSYCYDAAGKVVGSTVKAWPMPAWKAVLGVTGASELSMALVAELAYRCSDFDEAAVALPSALRTVDDTWIATGRRVPVTAILTGHGAGGPKIVVCVNDMKIGLTPFVAHDAGEVFATPSSPDFYFWMKTHFNLRRPDPARDAVAWMKWMRDYAPGLDGAASAVGGDIVCTTVRRDLISQRVAGRLG